MPNEVNLFRTFLVNEVLAALESLKHIPNEAHTKKRLHEHSEIDNYLLGPNAASRKDDLLDSQR